MKRIKTVDFKNTKITAGFWRDRQDVLKSSSVRAVYDRFKDTGRIDAMACRWREGEPNRPHVFWDSDVAKWLRAPRIFSLRRTIPSSALAVSR